MTTIIFSITADIEHVGRIQHLVTAKTEEAALQRLSRSYPEREMTVIKLLKTEFSGVPTNRKRLSATYMKRGDISH
ncbi:MULTISPECIES: hypothetical protein [Rhodobacterales]|uniref:Uncharacterized protein n=1 Tax=Roseovarius pacificus TaxID=337701 RepID=A0A1M6ZNZ9_9RHOB|nr:MULTISPECIES: hypothetical protein [Rhodobacterales]MBB4626849.1 hypothetical protein [Paracoccus denitrificans]MCU7427668.1 hypothetical protein [Paracoccus denitrificans]QAR24932.1 hypothetical protein EO213_00515 [Paracoccus denitrificans]UPV93893.1 hypothetical protein M0K93_08330 [Paracoccus denitrificans]WQO34171.1 hypothetical protein U0005_03655 [Paracoccus denitrificans]